MINFLFALAMFVLFASAAPLWLAVAGAVACWLLAEKMEVRV